MSEDKGGFDRYLEPGLIVSVRAEARLEVAAVVSSVVEDLISLELVMDGSEPAFQEGEQVSLRFWDQDVTAFHWSAEVGKLFPERNLVTLSTQGAAVVQRRKTYRVRTPIPFSATVIESAERELIGKHILDQKTQNLSVDGMLFQTNLPLAARDKLGIDLNLAETLNAVGWVVRTKPNSGDLNLIAVMFLMLDKEEQRQLVQLIGELA